MCWHLFFNVMRFILFFLYLILLVDHVEGSHDIDASTYDIRLIFDGLARLNKNGSDHVQAGKGTYTSMDSVFDTFN